MPLDPGVDADADVHAAPHAETLSHPEFADAIPRPGSMSTTADLADAECAGAAEISVADESHGDLHRVVWRLAWPSVLAMMLQTLNSFMDRGFVGRLGPDALAAVGVGGQMMFVLFSLGMSISVGATSLVARFTGAGEPDNARIAGNQAVWIAVLLSVASLLFAFPVCHGVVAVMHLSPGAALLCEKYVRISLLGIPGLFVMLILIGAYRGIGDTMTVLGVSVVVNIIHLGGDFLLIFGNFGAPRLGLPGGAMALVTSQYVGAVIYIALLGRTKLAGLITRKARIEAEWISRILKIGLPAALQNLSRILSMMAFTAVLARSADATSAVAALTIGMTSESIAFMPGFGFSVAASTLAGQNLGARRPERAERAAWVSLQQGIVVMTLMGVVFYVLAVQFSHIFTHDATVVRLAVKYLRISAFTEPFLALGMILTGALNGAGDTMAPAIAGVVTMWGLRLPLAYWLAISLGLAAVGAWWSMALSTVILGIVSYGLFKLGRWKSVKV